MWLNKPIYSALAPLDAILAYPTTGIENKLPRVERNFRIMTILTRCADGSNLRVGLVVIQVRHLFE